MGSKEEILQQWLDKGKEELSSAEYLSTNAKVIQEFVMKIFGKSANNNPKNE